ncbi:hypothetical protein V8C86DRAFT_3139025 [Haematococcus lacustris]
MSALDKAKEAAQQIGNRVSEATTEMKHDAAHSTDRATDATRDAGRHAQEAVGVDAQCERQLAGPMSLVPAAVPCTRPLQLSGVAVAMCSIVSAAIEDE